MFELNRTNILSAEKVVHKKTFAASPRKTHLPRERIRVLRIAHASLTPALRGRERGIAATFPEVDLQVVAPNSWRESGVDVEIAPDDLFRVRAAKTFLSSHIQLFAYDPRPIIKALREHRPHLIDMDHEPYSVPCAEILTIRNRYAPDTPIVMQTAQNIYKNYPPPFSFFEKRALEQVAAAYMCSRAVREVLRAKNFQKPMRIVPFGVDLKMFPFRKPQTKEVLTIGYVGRLLPAKGLLVLADALARIKAEKWRLLIVGDGEERDALKKKLAEHGLLERTEFAGAIPYDKTPDYFAKTDVLIVPTRTTNKIREQFGRVIIEAMASGVPVIGSTCGAIPEVIGDAGLIFEENDPTALAKHLRKILADKNLRENLSHAGRTRVEENYTWERVAAGIYELYRQVLENTICRKPL